MANLLESFVNVFGNKWNFFLTIVLTAVWLSFIFKLGFHDWNGTIGLAGNNYESTAEYFLEIAILYVARVTDRRTAAMREHQTMQLDHIEALQTALDAHTQAVDEHLCALRDYVIKGRMP
jgi:hypothetical protein